MLRITSMRGAQSAGLATFSHGAHPPSPLPTPAKAREALRASQPVTHTPAPLYTPSQTLTHPPRRAWLHGSARACREWQADRPAEPAPTARARLLPRRVGGAPATAAHAVPGPHALRHLVDLVARWDAPAPVDACRDAARVVLRHTHGYVTPSNPLSLTTCPSLSLTPPPWLRVKVLPHESTRTLHDTHVVYDFFRVSGSRLSVCEAALPFRVRTF